MNTNFLFVFLFIFLVILLTMYQLRLTSPITCLLTIITILILFKLIKQKEYFSDNQTKVMINVIQKLINSIEVKPDANADTSPTPQTTISQEEEVEEEYISESEKRSFLYMLKQILKELNKRK